LQAPEKRFSGLLALGPAPLDLSQSQTLQGPRDPPHLLLQLGTESVPVGTGRIAGNFSVGFVLDVFLSLGGADETAGVAHCPAFRVAPRGFLASPTNFLLASEQPVPAAGGKAAPGLSDALHNSFAHGTYVAEVFHLLS